MRVEACRWRGFFVSANLGGKKRENVKKFGNFVSDRLFFCEKDSHVVQN